MSNMNGNPHAGDGARYINEASERHNFHDPERAIIAANAQALATLALAYEQRTANMIAKLALSVQAAASNLSISAEVDKFQDEIDARLGINEGAAE